MNYLSKPIVGLCLCFLINTGCKKNESQIQEPVDLSNADTVDQISAVIYYVGTSGNNQSSTPTNSNTPWKTIQYAVDHAPAGSVIEILGGNYYEKVAVKRRLNGTANAPTIIRGRAGETVLIDGQSTGNQWESLFRIGADATPSAQCQYIQVSNLQLQNSYWYGISAENSNHIKIEYCATYKTRASGIYIANSSDINILNNNVRRACTAPERDQYGNGSQECITLTHVNNFIVAKNEVWDTVISGEGGEGIDAKGASYNGEIYENYVHDLYRNAIYVDAGSGTSFNIRVHRNRVYNCQSGGLTIGGEMGGFARDIYFFNNVVKDCQKSAFEFINIQGQPARFGNVYIVNNTFYNNAKNGFTGEVANFSPNTADYNITIKNNIFYNKSANPSRFSIFHNQASKHSISNNVFFDFRVSNNGANSYNLANVTSSASLQADPEFVDGSAANFHLKVTSPVRNNALLIYTSVSPYPLMFTSDFDYKNKGGSWDMGAFEY